MLLSGECPPLSQVMNPILGGLCDNYRATLHTTFQSLWKVFRPMFFSGDTDVFGELAGEVSFWRLLPESHICAGVTEQLNREA